jgi:TPR repeat protein
MVELGIIYDRDNELDKAYHWYSKAIETGSERGKERMKIFRQWLTLHKNEYKEAYEKYCLNRDEQD